MANSSLETYDVMSKHDPHPFLKEEKHKNSQTLVMTSFIRNKTIRLES